MENRRTGTHPKLSRREFLAAGTAGMAAVAGCLVRGESSELDGRIIIDGSNTVLPHTALLAYEFQWRNNRVEIPVRGSGTGAGFQRFAVGETDVQNASRPITDEEHEQCEANGVEYIELGALLDGIAIMINPENDWVDYLTAEELDLIWRANSPVTTWQDIREEWPDEEISFYGRTPDSGTFDSFTEMVTGEKGNIRSGYSASPDTNVIVRGVRGSENAMGFGGAGFYEANKDDLRAVPIRAGEDAVAIPPERETIESEAYYLSRPMFVYLNTNEFSREVLREFARFFFRPVDGDIDTDGEPAWTQWAARQVGYFAIADETVTESSNTLEAKIEEVLG